MTDPRPGGEHGTKRGGWKRAALLLVPLLAGAFPAQGCSFIVDTSAIQCKSDLDCQTKGDVRFKDSTCIDNVCQPAPGCTTHAECFTLLEQPAICRPFDLTCVPLFTETCLEANMAEGALATIKDDPSTIVLGVLAPFTTEQQSTGRAIFNSTTVAVQEITNVSRGIPVPGTSKSRPFVFIPCDDNAAVASTNHLVNTLKVPAIIGPQFSGTLLNLVSATTIAGRTLLISSSATASTITDLPDNDLVWRTAPPDTLQAQAIAGLLSKKLEAEVRTAVAAGAADKLKLAVVHKSDAYGTGLESNIRSTVTLNGEALSSSNPSYKAFDYGDPKDTPALEAGLPAKVADIAANAPHIIVIIGTVEAATKVLPAIEAGWTEPKYRARYILTDGVQSAELEEQVKGKAELAARISGTAPGTQSKPFDDFLFRYRTKFGTSAPSPNVFGTAGAYDATYMLAYSISAAGEEPLRGELIAKGFSRLLNGTATELGSEASKGSAFGVLANGGDLNIDGASGPLDFNPVNGDARSDIQVWCLSLGATPPTQNTGLFLDAAGNMAGTYKCP